MERGPAQSVPCIDFGTGLEERLDFGQIVLNRCFDERRFRNRGVSALCGLSLSVSLLHAAMFRASAPNAITAITRQALPGKVVRLLVWRMELHRFMAVSVSRFSRFKR